MLPHRNQADQSTHKTCNDGDKTADYFHPPFSRFTSFPFLFAYCGTKFDHCFGRQNVTDSWVIFSWNSVNRYRPEMIPLTFVVEEAWPGHVQSVCFLD